MAAPKKTKEEKTYYPEGVSSSFSPCDKKVFEILDDSAALYPNKTALSFYGKSYSYSEVLDFVNRFAKGLQSKGVKKGDPVGLFLPNCPQYVFAYYAILKIGAVVVNFNPMYTIHELKKLVTQVDLRIMVTLNLKDLHEKTGNLLQTTSLETVVVANIQDAMGGFASFMFRHFKKDMIAAVQYGRVNVAFDEMVDNLGKYRQPEELSADEVAVLQFSGGTTGVPKAVQLSHKNLYSNAMQCANWFYKFDKGKEKILAVLPFFHVFSMTAILNVGIHLGAEIVIHPKFDKNQVIKDLKKKSITVFPGVPTLFSVINNSPISKNVFKSLKLAVSGGAPLPVEVKSSFEEKTGCQIVEGYGLSESSPVLTVNVPFVEGKNKPGSAGLPVPGTTIEIRETEGSRKKLPIKEVGEICAKGPQIMLGYLNDEKQTKATIKSNRLHTGDMGYLDKDGYLFIVDRLKDMIISKGYNVYPREIEEELYLHHKIEEAAVIGVKDKIEGQKIKAFIKLRLGEEMDAKEIKSFLKGKIAPYKLPDIVEFKDDLPKTLIGKIDKKLLMKEE